MAILFIKGMGIALCTENNYVIVTALDPPVLGFVVSLRERRERERERDERREREEREREREREEREMRERRERRERFCLNGFLKNIRSK